MRDAVPGLNTAVDHFAVVTPGNDDSTFHLEPATFFLPWSNCAWGTETNDHFEALAESMMNAICDIRVIFG